MFTLIQFTLGLTLACRNKTAHVLRQLVGLHLFFLMTTQAAAQEMQALSIPRRDGEMPEVINSGGGAEGLHDIQH